MPRLLAACLGVLAFAASAAPAAEPAPAAVDYNRDVRPILSDKCFRCHGPDATQRQAGLRFDTQAGALTKSDSGARAIVPGKPAESALVERIHAADPESVMPPPAAKKPLTAAEKKTLEQWIAAGAPFQTHWSFLPPRRPQLPKTRRADWARQPIDHFVLARLEAEGLAPAPEADPATLLRRVTLDLTGLPPTLAELDAFLADWQQAPDAAYERAVDRLFASPHYGERLAVDWLDAARFADTHGYHIDSGRDMTRWREYVIDAFHRNLPYDRFTVEQLAGDLLPEAADPAATLRQRIASGFNRNHMINFEGGAIAQEYHTAYIVDRVNTTSTIWLGLTVACTQCHDHKYDPLTQREFYQLYAFFNNVPENGLDGAKGNAAPLLKAPTMAQQQELDHLSAAIAEREKQLAAPLPKGDQGLAEWLRTARARRTTEWQVIEPAEAKARGGARLARQDDRSLLVTGANPPSDVYEATLSGDWKGLTGWRLEALPDPSLKAKGPGRSENGNFVLTGVRSTLVAANGQEQVLKHSAAAADFSQDQFPVAGAIDGDAATGWAIHPQVGRPHWAAFELAAPQDVAGGAKLRLSLEFQSKFAQHQAGRIRLAVTTTPEPLSAAELPAAIVRLLELPADARTAAQEAELAQYYAQHAAPGRKAMQAELAEWKARLAEIERQIPTTMVMQESPALRETFVLTRGQYDQKGEKVTADVPAALPPLPAEAPRNRLGLAQWLVSPEHPLTARVTVNRYWQLLFGVGIVKSAEDFGSQGERPSHPELLDWLAVEFVAPTDPAAVPWDVRRLLKQLVMSATYRQSSRVTPELAARDPENRLLARGPRFRLQAEFLRDQALAASGLLNRQIGGRSVSPYQPPGLWEELMSRADNDKWTAQKYKQDHGEDLYRRTMYTFWKRTCPPASLATLDAPDRETCTVRRSRTNTPLQALVLLNDPTYVEAARKLAERILREGGPSLDDRLAFAFRLVTSRRPAEREQAVLKRVYEQQLAHYRQQPAAAASLLQVGEAPRDERLDAAELAAWAVVASALLNLDEVVTKG